MTGTPLADLFVKLVADGIQDVNAATAEITKRFKEAEKGATLLEKAISSGAYRKMAKDLAVVEASLKRVKGAARFEDLVVQYGKVGASIMHLDEQTKGFTNRAAAGFAILSAGVMGWVRAGMQGTVEGNQLALQFTLLSREIAGVFKPVIDDVIGTVAKVVKWFQNLSKEEQGNIRRWVLWTAGILGAVVAFKIALAIGSMLVTTWIQLRGAIMYMTTSLTANAAAWRLAGKEAEVANAKMNTKMGGGKFSGTMGFVKGLIILEAGVDAAQQIENWNKDKRPGIEKAGDIGGTLGIPGSSVALLGKKKEDEGKDDQKKDRDRVTLQGGGFESVAGTWERMMEASMMLGPEGGNAELAKIMGDMMGYVQQIPELIRLGLNQLSKVEIK